MKWNGMESNEMKWNRMESNEMESNRMILIQDNKMCLYSIHVDAL